MRTESKTLSLAATLVAALVLLAAPFARAAQTPRVAHTATLLPTGNILITGGIDTTPAVLNTTELRLASKGTAYKDGPNMTAARSSHTATVMTNGCVLIAGGWTGAAARSDADIYDPAKNTITNVTGLTARYSHTATLLNNGKVLLCGGQTTDAAGTVTNTCDLFTPTNSTDNNCSGSFAAAAPMQLGRARHTAVLLKDGKVWFAGGLATSGYTPTTERYDPVADAFSSAQTLAEARVYHTATMMGDGKVLVAGGYNGQNKLENIGILDTLEIYDPVANTITPGPTLSARREMHSATLSADGTVMLFGGLGNITTSYVTPTPKFNEDPPGVSDSRILVNTGNGAISGAAYPLTTVAWEFSLGKEVAGTLADAEVRIPRFELTVPSGKAVVNPMVVTLRGTPVDEGGVVSLSDLDLDTALDATGGTMTFDDLALSLSGAATGGTRDLAAPGFSAVTFSPTFSVPAGLIGATLAGTISGLAGTVTSPSYTSTITDGTITLPGGVVVSADNDVTFAATAASLVGTTVFSPATGLSLNSSPATAGVYNFTTSPLTNGAQDNLLATSNVSFPLTITLPSDLSGARITGTIAVKGGTITGGTAPNTYSIALTGGSISVTNADAVGTLLTLNATINNLAGTITVGSAGSINSGDIALPPSDIATGLWGDLTYTAVNLLPTASASVSLAGTMAYRASQVDVSGLTIGVSVSTAVIRSMVFGQAEFFNPQANQVSFSPPNGAMAASPAIEAFGHTATLLPDTDVFIAGGFDCTAGCAGFDAKDSGGLRFDLTILPTVRNFSATSGSLGAPRAFHTSTLLPDKTILVAGGTNGPNVLGTAEIFDPAAGTFSATNTPMRAVRDLHTATLLPNGRVLLAGGFTTNAASTGSTNSAEVYYPDTKTFIQTSLMISSRSNHTATTLPDGNVMVFGGFGPDDVITGTAEIYFSTSGAWKPLASSSPRALHTATLLKDGRLMVAGGVDSTGVLNTVKAYDYATNTWADLAVMPVALRSHSATLLFDGRVLVAGGNNGFGEVDASYIYTPGTDIWAPTAAGSPLGEPRFGHTATLLPDGSVMISGGSTRFGEIPATIEVYRIDASSWVPTGGPFAGGARAFHTMTLAADGKVYAIGGSNGVIGGAGTSLWGPAEQGYFTADADAYTKNAPPSIRKSTITSTSATPFSPATSLTVNGQRFRGGTEASGGGAGAASSSFSFPRMILQRIGGPDFAVDLTTRIAMNTANQATLDTSLSVTLPPIEGLPTGWYNARVGANGVYSDGAFVQAGPAKPASAPTGLAGTTQGTSSITWNWNALAGVDGYNVYRASDGVFIGTTTATTLIQTGLPPNTACAVLVAGYTITGDGPAARSATLFTLTRPEVTSVAGAADSTTSVQWSWLDPGGSPSFKVYNSTSGDLLAQTSLTTYADTGLGVNTPRAISVRTVTADGDGTLCAAATVYTLAAAPDTIVPQLSGLTTGSFTLNWSENGNPDGTSYLIEIYASSDTSAAINSVTTTSRTVGIGGLNPGTSYASYITARNGDGLATLPLVVGSTYTLSQPPSNLRALATTASSIQVAWDPGSNPSSTIYEVTYSSDNFTLVIATAVAFSSAFSGSTVTISGLLTSVTYSIRAKARNPFGQVTQFSNIESTVTYNGGAPPGDLAGVLTALSASEIAGSIMAGAPNPDGARYIDFRSPGGAFSSDVKLTISSYNVASPLCADGLNIALDLEVAPRLQPLKPVHLRVSYNPAELLGISPSRLALMRYEPASRTCVPLSTVFDTKSNAFTASLNHFSLYQVAQVPVATRADTARVFPNPYRASSDGYVTIDKIPPFSRVRVTTLRGETVFDQQADSRGILVWTPTNGTGRTVASGLYLIAVEAAGTKKILKLAVIR